VRPLPPPGASPPARPLICPFGPAHGGRRAHPVYRSAPRGVRLPRGQAAATQPSLIALNDKIAATAGNSAGDELYTRSLRLCAAASQPGGTTGECRHKYNSADFELHAATITGADEESDIRSLLATRLSVVRKCLANVSVRLVHAVTNRASILSTALPRYAAPSIISSGACELGVPSSSAVTPALARSLLDGSGLGSMAALCRPLIALRCDPCAGFKLLAELKGPLAASQVRDLLPPETIRQLHKAYSQLFSELGYLEFDTFCSSLVDLVCLSSRCGRLLDGKVAEFVGTCLSHVSDLVKNHFSSTSNDDKITVSFMSGPGREILTAADNAASAFVSHVDMGLLPAHSSNSTPSTGPLFGGGPPPTPAAAATRKKGHTSEAAAAPTGKRARAQESEPAANSRSIAVTVDGDLVRKKYFEYSRKEIEDTIGRSLDEACLPALLGGKNSRACPMPNDKGHEQGGRLRDCKGKDL
jgi:hypothetical protein